MTRRISHDEERRLHRSAGFYFTTPCCPPVLLHISRHSRQFALSIYRQCSTPSENGGQGLMLWYQAVNSFREEWEEYAFWEDWENDQGGDERKEFFEREKDAFDEAKNALARRTEKQVGDQMELPKVKLKIKKGYNLKDRGLNYEGKWLKRAKGIFKEGKRFMERVKSGQGVWYRPSCDVFLLWRDKARILTELVAEMTGEWVVGDVRRLAVEESWDRPLGSEWKKIWRVLFGRRGDLDENSEQKESDSESDEMEEMPLALFTSLDEITVVVSEGYHSYRDETNPMIRINYTKDTIERRKEECRLRILQKLQKDSALTKIPVVKVVGDDELLNQTRNVRYPWSRATRDECENGHREDCYR
ncbi:hypothetical protein N431DRAFT_424815 [Stipitochalara longipes BDJ]|nr:hypothetical protein N431DRAFT_424815 [Stipitochalara longipes BDJ]